MSAKHLHLSPEVLPASTISPPTSPPPAHLPLSNDIEKSSLPPTSTTTPEEPQPQSSLFKSLSILDRFLALWIFLAMAIGIILGNFVPNTAETLQRGTFVGVSVPIGGFFAFSFESVFTWLFPLGTSYLETIKATIGLLVMMYPILCKVKFETLHHAFRTRDIWIQIAFSIVVNWIVAPLVMLGLSYAFLPDKEDLRTGLILVGIARCIAMVLIWTQLANGDTQYCAILVAINSLLQMILFAPLALLFINVISDADAHSISYPTIASSIGVFLGIPLGAAILTRIILLAFFPPRILPLFLQYLSPLSLLGLLFTILILFAAQGARITHSIVSVVRVAAPLVVYFAVIFTATLYVTYKFGFGYKVACTQSFTAASNNFELAIAVAVAMYGVDSEQALAATVGPLVEVPVLLGLVYVVRWAGRRWGWKE
ncbi:putative arsenite efflux transporter protein [Rutstroemia sp. NJR-2017a BBW]|nr:putative arsenite efflux transporter protein [Rutstroemia sp. NJR-2017a BBW]PQE08583.1 putative arsenite efflux transporter protein [Rutstroemia sp. NJR-2017a BBW]